MLLAYAITYEDHGSLSEASYGRRLKRLRGWIGELLAEHHAEYPAAALFLAREEAMAGRWRAAWPWLEVAAAGELDPIARPPAPGIRFPGLWAARRSTTGRRGSTSGTAGARPPAGCWRRTI